MTIIMSMTSLIVPSTITLIRRSDRQLDPIDDRRLRRAIDTGEWTRVVPGAFAESSEWARLSPIERHRLFVDETMRRLRHPAVASHRSAAAKWDIDILGPWPSRLDITTDARSGGRSSGLVQRHALGLDDVERVPWEDHEITTPAQTALDLARTLPFVKAVSAVDQAVWTERRGGPLTTIDEIRARLEGSRRRPGDVRARRVLDFANSHAANVRESQSRVVVVQLGFPMPIVQYRRVLRGGRLAFSDLFFEREEHWCEIDGRGKYLSPEFGIGRSPDEIVIDEKNRENEIRREVRGFSRWEAAEADNPRRIWDILTGDGMPCSKPRP